MAVFLNKLVKKLPRFTESRMVSNGFGVWVAWKGDLNQSVPQTMADYGGMLVAQEHAQSLWFFLSSDVVLALAKLEVWVRFNPLPVFIQIFPAKMLVGYKLEVSMGLDTALGNQEAIIPDEFEVWVHPRVQELAKGIPGLSFKSTKPYTGLATVNWGLLQADSRLPYQASLGWYLLLKPLGNPLDKGFQNGWREFFPELELLIKRNKLRFMIHDFYLMAPLENLRVLRGFCQEFLQFIRKLKEEGTGRYWPCAVVIVERKGLNYNVDLPKKVLLDWDQLMPDFPHMNYRTAFLLGDHFRINDVRFSVEQNSLDDWCNVSLSKDYDQESGVMQVELPKRLVSGKEAHCFYCGLRSHPLQKCPSRMVEELQLDIWEDVARLDFSVLNQSLEGIDKALAADPEGGIVALLQSDNDQGLLVRAMFEINAPVQFRMSTAVWRSVGKDYPRGLQQLAPVDKSPAWEALHTLRQGEPVQAERILNQALLKSPRDLKIRNLQGYAALERGDMPRAIGIWKEAEVISSTPLQQGQQLFLQARCLEIQGKLQQASSLYKMVLHLCPRWVDAQYRQGVCLVKMGFADQAMGFFEELFQRDAHIFNRMLIDSELERGHLQLLAALYTPWTSAELKAGEEKENLDSLSTEIRKWFSDEQPKAEQLRDLIARLKREGEIRNYVAFSRVAQGRVLVSRELMSLVDDESKRMKSRFQSYMERLKVIQAEASWFPFPRILVEFNKEFNYCARSLNWALTQHFQMAENFRRASELVEKVEERLLKLESQLKTLKIVRDSTLFLLILGKTFFWLELIGLALGLVLLPLGMWYAQDQGYTWAVGMTESEKWALRRGVIIILSVLALSIAALRSALIFESRKEQLFRRAQAL